MSLSRLSGPTVLIVNLCRYETHQTQHSLHKTKDTSSVVVLTINSRKCFLLCTYMSPRHFLIVDIKMLSIKIINSLTPCQSQYATVIALVVHF